MLAPPSSPAPRKRVLVVDDDETNRDLARHILQLSRFAVDVAVSGEEALVLMDEATAAGFTYDIVVADLMMPGMSGTDLASVLVERGKPPRLVCVTGRVAPTTLEMCAAAGFD
ncbi:MAG: response regulator, partial [Bacteroidota bacterium]